jgi:hypothetical protein
LSEFSSLSAADDSCAKRPAECPRTS